MRHCFNKQLMSIPEPSCRQILFQNNNSGNEKTTKHPNLAGLQFSYKHKDLRLIFEYFTNYVQKVKGVLRKVIGDRGKVHCSNI